MEESRLTRRHDDVNRKKPRVYGKRPKDNKVELFKKKNMGYERDAKLGSPLYNPRKTQRGVISKSLGPVTLCSVRVSRNL